MELHDVGKDITFESFCDACTKIKSAKGQNKSEILVAYLQQCRKSPNDMNPDLYPLLRLLLPNAERERGSYGIKEATFAKLYVRILNLPKEGNDAMKLTNYKAPTASSSMMADFAEVAYWVLRSRCKQSTKVFTLEDINMHLDNIASFQNSNLPRAIDDELTKLTNSMPVMQQKWFIRIVLKDLKLGIGQNKIFNSFHSDAADLFDSTSSLQKVCQVLYSPNIHLHEIEVDLFSAFRPMLSEKLDITKINNVMKHGDLYFMETKFDGERFQIHMKNGVFKYFSRNGFDYTEHYGENYENDGMFTKYLKNLIDPSVQSFIIDGEMMGWHKTKKAFSSKGINFDVKKITDQSSYQPCFCAFDILLYNDSVLTNKPLYERLNYLDGLFKDEEGIILHSIRNQVQESDKVLEALNKAIENQEEGIVIKRIDSLYKPNSRKAGWFKIKPEYTDGVMNELDLLIIGGYYADNKRYGMVGSVLLGVADSSVKLDNVPVTFHACGRVKLTLVRDEFEELCSKLQPFWKPVTKETNPPSVCWTKDRPDVWIEPRDSFILQVKASELVRSNQYKTEFTLRFPRVENVRYDKPWYDCLTCEEFNKLTEFSHGVEKLTSRKIGAGEMDQNEISPRKKAFTLSDRFRPVSSDGIQEKSALFAGKEFCIVTGNETASKSELEKKVLENGGKIVQNPGRNTFCIIAGGKSVRITNLMNSGEFDIATVGWFLRTLEAGRLLEWTPRDLLAPSKKTAQEFIFKFDEYGDSYTIPATRNSLNYSMKEAEKSTRCVHLMQSELSQMDKILFNGINPYSFLRNCIISFYNEEESLSYSKRMDILKINIQFYGGIFIETINNDTTHLIVDTFDRSTIKNIAKKIADLNCAPPIVTTEWLNRCFDERQLCDITDYVIDPNKFCT